MLKSNTLILFFLISTFTYLVSCEQKKNINVNLKSTWLQTSIIAETSEFLSQESPELFWKFAETIDEKQTDKENYEHILETVGKLQLSDLKIKMLKFALSLRNSSPKIVTFMKLAKQHLTTDEKNIERRGDSLIKTVQNSSEIFEFDHYFPKRESHSTKIILYSKLGSNEFKKLHEEFSKKNVDYYFRHYDPKQDASENYEDDVNESKDLLHLQGYGVELQIKNMEYNAMDKKDVKKEKKQETVEEENEIDGVNFEVLQKEYPNLKKDLLEFKQSLLQDSKKDVKIDSWEISDVGIQTAQKIVSSSSPFHIFEQIAQNFPAAVKSIYKMKVNSSVAQEIKENQEILEEGKNLFFINGRTIDLEKFTPFTFLDILQNEISFYDKFDKLKVKSEVIPKITTATQDFNESPRFDVTDESVISFVNDLTKDPMYGRMSSNIEDILKRGFYGPMWTRHNLFNAVIICDPSTREGLDLIRDAFNIYRQGYPARIGLVLVGNNELKQYKELKHQKPNLFFNVDVQASQSKSEMRSEPTNEEIFGKVNNIATRVTQVFEYIKEKKSVTDAFYFLIRLNHGVRSSTVLDESVLKYEFRNAPKDMTYEQVITNEKYLEKAKKSIQYIHKKGFNENPILLFNGKLTKPSVQAFNDALNQEYVEVAKLIQAKKIKGDDNQFKLYSKIYNSANEYHPGIFQKEKKMIAIPQKHIPWMEANQNVKKFSHIICGDIESSNSRKTLVNALSHINDKESISRISFLPINNKPQNLVTRIFLWLTLHSELQLAIDFLKLYETSQGEEFPLEFVLKKLQVSFDINDMTYEKVLDNHSQYCQNLVQEKESNWIITNGRVLNLSKFKFDQKDFSTLEASEELRIKDIVKEIPNASSDDILYITSLLAHDLSKTGPRATIRTDQLKSKFSGISTKGKNENIEVIAIVDPLSSEAQKLSTLLTILNDHFQFSIKMFLNPKLSTSEMPLKSWYRYVLFPELEFDQNKKIKNPTANFKQLSPKNILTMNLHVQETWLIGLTYSIYDLDNIKLNEIEGKDLNARYQLENIIISGSCTSNSPMDPPRGLELTLNTKGKDQEQDTLVMASYGYFQLKSNPNIWDLNIAKGRHSEIYEILEYSSTNFYDQKIKNTIKPTGENKVSVHLLSFDGPYIFLKVGKKKGKETEKLIEDPRNSKGIFGSISKLFKKKENEDDEDDENTVNIFSVASGHMYERLLKIMILSVLKHTKKSKVKFWFLKNYLSPQFKEYLPLMAKRYNFKFGLVAYKWPTWLNKQSVKMRKIWAYKVLFLDVLFPLKVKRIIFVDADQVCRTDMTELFKMDLEGKSVGYTPFCSDKPEMDGFKFWKGGYWGNYLRGKPYHISALYVVDIAQLRFDYSGDSYRMIYDSLSKDPNSLSNLDQDLPNYAQHQIPIFSLPQEWLWCEAWCSDKSKGKAKTIDLCNNPQTKENKIDSARRIVPEWDDYDKEHKKFEKELREKNMLKFK